MASLNKFCPLRAIFIAAASLLPIALIVHATTFWGHGIIDSEAMEFVLNYLQRRPFFAQIFDPQINDWGAYQARELSYVFDWVDARTFAALLDRQLLIFIPLSGVLGLVALGAVYFWGARKVFGLNAGMVALLLSLFLSCIVVQASTPILYRSSKIILCIALLGFLFYLSALLKVDKREVTLSKRAVLFCLGLIMAICDRQGFYYLVSATVIILMLWVLAKLRKESRCRACPRALSATFAAILATIFYNRVFTPSIVHTLNGYWPDFAYQNLPWSKLFDPALPGKAFHIFADQVSFFFGNIPFVAIVLVAVLATFWKRRGLFKIDNLALVAASLVSIFAVLGLLVAMIARHPAVYSVRDHEFWYYTLTLHVVFLFGVTSWLSLVHPDRRARISPPLYIAIAILIALNVINYQRQRELMIHSTGWFDVQYAHSQELLQQFRTDPPRREKIQSTTSDLFLDDQAHFLENVERPYLHLIGAIRTERPPRQ